MQVSIFRAAFRISQVQAFDSCFMTKTPQTNLLGKFKWVNNCDGPTLLSHRCLLLMPGICSRKCYNWRFCRTSAPGRATAKQVCIVGKLVASCGLPAMGDKACRSTRSSACLGRIPKCLFQALFLWLSSKGQTCQY